MNAKEFIKQYKENELIRSVNFEGDLMASERQVAEMLDEYAKIKVLNIPLVMHRFFQEVAEYYKVPTDRVMLAITDNGKKFQAYATNNEETEIEYLQDYTIPNGV